MYCLKFGLTNETSWHELRWLPYDFHCQTAYASQRMTGSGFSCTCIVMYRNIWFAESTRVPALWRQPSKRTKLFRSFKGDNLTSTRNVKITKKFVIARRGSRDFRQIRFALVSSLYFSRKLGSPKPPSYRFFLSYGCFSVNVQYNVLP